MNDGCVMEVAGRLERSVSRKADEVIRVAKVKDAKEKDRRRRVVVTVMTDAGKSRTVKKMITTCDKMLAQKQMPKYLKTAVDAYAQLVADAHGAATEDQDDSSNRMTCGYEPMSGGSFGSKTVSDRQLFGIGAEREMKKRIPMELKQTFDQIVGEETGHLSVIRRVPATIGEEKGFKHRQASSAGAMEVLAVCYLIAHFMRERGLNVTPQN